MHLAYTHWKYIIELSDILRQRIIIVPVNGWYKLPPLRAKVSTVIHYNYYTFTPAFYLNMQSLHLWNGVGINCAEMYIDRQGDIC